MQTYTKVNDKYYPINEKYARCCRCKAYVPVNEMNKNGYECLECSRKRAKEYYRRRLQKV